MKSWIVGLALLAGCAAQAQHPASEATPQQKARSHVASAFMTGAAPAILSDKVALGPELQARLGLPPGTESGRIYDALIGLTQGATPHVSDATADEAKGFPDLAPPLFTVSAGDLKLLLRYDLQANNVSFAEQLSGPPIAAASPVAEPPTPAPAAQAAKEEPVYSVVEPKAPPKAPAKPRVVKANAAPAPARPTPAPPPLKPSGPCIVKPVMSDQDLVNCGATPPRY
jgi:hypothetical protein